MNGNGEGVKSCEPRTDAAARDMAMADASRMGYDEAELFLASKTDEGYAIPYPTIPKTEHIECGDERLWLDGVRRRLFNFPRIPNGVPWNRSADPHEIGFEWEGIVDGSGNGWRYTALTSTILGVARVFLPTGGLRVYLGTVRGINHESEWQDVRDRGDKMFGEARQAIWNRCWAGRGLCMDGEYMERFRTTPWSRLLFWE